MQTSELITDNHYLKINKLILESKKIILCTGWLNKPGIKKIFPALSAATKKSVDITIYSNSKHTKSDAKKLISSETQINHIVIKHEIKYLHSKVYYFEFDKTYAVIIGSANLTEGGLTTNEELSILEYGEKNSSKNKELLDYFKKLNMYNSQKN